MNSVLVDTSFLITLSDPARERHAVAKEYFKACIQRRVPLFLSSIVVSEYQVRQAINDLQHPLDSFDIDFTFLYRIEAGKVWKCVEINCPAISIASDLPQQFDGLERVDRAHHQAIVALGIAIVQMDAQ